MSQLGDFHSLLISHFIKLSEERRRAGYPTFALEHPLTESEVETLKSAIQHRQQVPPLIQDWMAWVVYSTELGYSFDGREYWESFEKATPNWNVGDREFIRKCFQRFVDKFNGYVPTGAWAQHRSIIAYPITHSVIPRDLQQEFAKVLYDLRYYLSGSIEQRSELGRRIAEVSFDASNRFQQLAQNTELMGLVATQLLAPGGSASEQLLQPNTLARIAKDVRRHRDAARWLDEARSHAKNNSTERLDPKRTPRTLIEMPMLYLQRSRFDYWDLWVEIPNLSSLWDVEPEVFRFLQTNRMQIVGNAINEKLPPQTISTYGPTRRRLTSLPPMDSGILTASGELPSRVKDFLKKFRPNDIQLVFEIKDDGRAFPVGTVSVSPGEKFLYFSNTAPSIVGARQIESSLTDVSLFEFSIPDSLNAQDERFLASVGLRVDTDDSIHIQGLGSVPFYSEPDAIAFFEGETPILAVDSTVETRIQLVDDEGQLIIRLTPGQRNFIALDLAPVGVRTIRVLVHDITGLELERIRIITLPRGSRSNLSTRSPFALITNPFAPTLNVVESGRAQFELIAPDNTEVLVFISLPADNGDSGVENELFRFRTPVDGLGLKMAESIEKLETRLATRLDDAFRCIFRFTAENLGNIEIACARDSLPVRWRVKTEGDKRVLQLANYSDSNKDIKVNVYALTSPDKALPLPEFELGCSEKTLNGDTGMFVASCDGKTAGIIVFPPAEHGRVLRNFGDLGHDRETEIHLTQIRRSESDFIRLLEVYWLWATSPHAGDPLKLVYLKLLKEVLTCELISCVGGEPNWRKCETQFSRGKQTKRNVLEAVTRRHSLQNNLQKLSERTVSEVIDLVPLLAEALQTEIADHTTRLARKGGVQALKIVRRSWFSEFALRLATAPETLPAWADKRLSLGVTVMFQKPILPRAARYLYLMQKDSSINWRWDV